MPTWKDLKRFCENDGWELYKNTDHFFFRKRNTDGSIRLTKVSRGSDDIHAAMWQNILKKQLRVTKKYFNSKI